LEAAMLMSTFGWTFMLSMALMMQSPSALAQPPTILGTWAGTVAQNSGKSNYSVIMTITSTGAETNYPELNCGGKLRRVGTSKGYVFFMETITRGGKNSGGSCIDGAVTVAQAGTNLAWGWVGSYGGQVYVAWSNLLRK
jgi:hypothetical protein